MGWGQWGGEWGGGSGVVSGVGAVGWGQWGGEWGGDEHVAACAILLSILVSLQVTHKHVIHVL